MEAPNTRMRQTIDDHPTLYPTYTIEDASQLLHKSARWLRDYLRRNPDCCYRAGRTTLLDATDINRIKTRLRQAHPCRSSSLIRAQARRLTTASGAPTSASTLTELQKL